MGGGRPIAVVVCREYRGAKSSLTRGRTPNLLRYAAYTGEVNGQVKRVAFVEVILIPVLVFAEGAGGGETYQLVAANAGRSNSRETVFAMPTAGIPSVAISVSPST